MKTTTTHPRDIKTKWYVIDAADYILGRMATIAASRLRGKHKPGYAPHLDCGDHIVIINASKVKVTGNKEEKKLYYRHSEYPGGLSTTDFATQQAKHPTRSVELAIKGMLPKGPLGNSAFRKLKVYAGAEHPHQAQMPEKLTETTK
jgi:large subunit ribosomal protein L13